LLKIRLQGTEQEIEWFKKILLVMSQIKVKEFSELYSNNGTKKYFRAYSEIEKVDEVEA